MGGNKKKYFFLSQLHLLLPGPVPQKKKNFLPREMDLAFLARVVEEEKKNISRGSIIEAQSRTLELRSELRLIRSEQIWYPSSRFQLLRISTCSNHRLSRGEKKIFFSLRKPQISLPDTFFGLTPPAFARSISRGENFFFPRQFDLAFLA